jgi:hypothetical protein
MKLYRNTWKRFFKISLHHGSYVSELCIFSTFYISKRFIFNKVLCYMRIALLIRYSDWRRATGWVVLGMDPSDGKYFLVHPDKPRGPPSLL